MDEGDKLLRGRVREKCKLGLRQAFELIHPDRPVDARGYTHVLADNLIVADLEDDIRSEFGAGAGGELRRMMAVHSSAALAVNAFAPLRRANIRFALAGESNLQVIDFEATRPIADLSRIPPHLDAVCASRDAVVAIESKCTEYLSPKVAAFSDEYLVVRGLPDVSPWFEEMRRIKSADTESYRFLDAAQLIKHAFGLAYAREDRPTTLLYLYWQPRDADLSPLLANMYFT